MFMPLTKTCVLTWAICLSTVNIAKADAGSFTAVNWAAQLQSKIKQHPVIIAAKQTKLAGFSMAANNEQALYNPNVDAEFEREGDDNNYRIGINQTIDIWNKREVRTQQAKHNRLAADARYQLVLEQHTASTLATLINWQADKKRSDLAFEQEQQMDILLKLISQRQQAGDIGDIDSELIYLSLSQRLNSSAKALSSVKRSEAKLKLALPNWPLANTAIPEQLWLQASQANDYIIDEHPAVSAAKAQWLSLKEEHELVRRASKAEPNIGFNAGKTGDDNVIGLSFSMPLNFRNNYSARSRAAGEKALASEAIYRAINARQNSQVTAASDAMLAYQQQYIRWEKLVKGRDHSSLLLIEKQWNSGDTSVQEYLLALQQRYNGLLAGIELQEQFQIMRVNYLLQTGTTTRALTQLSQQSIKESSR